MSVINKILKNWYYILGILFGLYLFFAGRDRITNGILPLMISDPSSFHILNKGILYAELGLIIMTMFTLGIAYSLIKFKK